MHTQTIFHQIYLQVTLSESISVKGNRYTNLALLMTLKI